ncbi:beta-propeller fold lactonase family protein [Beggiatoa alba]|uniref:beta-propeller fold lactonase family protein n=1 Tax=Beggiatoa alba TaxID=1022 RepID=UPI0018DEDD42|nr:beta-propeller fold lactonase family protein [Beggiatoa alba]
MSLWILCIAPSASALTFINAQVDGASVDGVNGLARPNGIAISPDGAFLYATGSTDNAINVFQRDTVSSATTVGQLTFVQTVTSSHIANNGLMGANAIAVSPDGKHVYVTGVTDSSLTVFTRNTATGMLSLVEVQKDGVGTVSAMQNANVVTLSPDGTRVYVTSPTDNALNVFSRDSNTGLLTLLGVQIDGVNGVNGLAGAADVKAVSDGTNTFIYVASTVDNAVSVFAKQGSSELVFLGLYQEGVNDLTGLQGANGLVFSPTNNHLYVASPTSNAVASFTRNSDGTLTPLAVYTNNVNGFTGLGGARYLATNSDGSKVYVAGFSDNTLVSLKRDTSTGLLSIDDVAKQGTTANTLTGVSAIATSGAYIYAAAYYSNAVNTFAGSNENLQITAVSSTSSLSVNTAFTYTATVSNTGLAATNIVVTNTLPNGITLNTTQALPSACVAQTASSIVCSVSTLAEGQSVNFALPLTSSTTEGTLTLKSQVVSSKTTTAKSVSVNVVVETVKVDLEIIQAFASPSTIVDINTNFSYIISLQNKQNSASGVKLTATLPSEVSYVSGTQGCNGSSSASTVTCNLGVLDALGNASTNVTLIVKANSLSTGATTSFNVSSNNTDASTSNNTKAVTVSIVGIVAEVGTSITSDRNSVLVDENITYVITATNSGPSSTAANLQAVLAGTATISSVTAANGTCSSVTNNAFTCTIAALTSTTTGNTSTVTVVAKANALGTATLQATVTPTVYDPTTANNTATRSVTVTTPAADLGVSLTASPSPILVGNNLTYTATVTNAGPSTANTVTITQTLPTGTTIVGTPSITNGQCSVSGSTVTCTVSSLSSSVSQNSVVLTTVVKTNNSGTLSSTLNATVATPSDSNSANNTTTLATTVTQSSADLAVSAITATPDPVLVGNLISYNTTITNNGTDSATAVVLTQTLESTVSFVSTSNSNCAHNAGVITCNLGTIANAQTQTITIVAQPNGLGSIGFTAKIASDSADPNTANNTKTLTSQVTTPTTLIYVENLRDGSNAQNLQRANGVTVSPDGAYVYVSSFGSSAVSVFSRNASNAGRLTYLSSVINGVNGVTGLSGASNAVVTPDGKHLYAAGYNDNSVAVFSRNITTGALSFITSYSGLAGAFALVATDSYLYVANVNDDSITVFSRDANTGNLSLVETQRSGLLDNIVGLTLSPDGKQLLAAASVSNSINVYSRDTSTGKLSLLQTISNNANGVTGLGGVSSLTVTTDGKFAYAVSGSDNAITTFSRNAETGVLSFIEMQQDGVNGLDGLSGAFAVIASPDGNYVYVTATTDNALAVFVRNTTTGLLTLLSVLTDGVNSVDGLAGARGLALSTGGANIYTTGFNDNAVATFRISSADVSLSLQANPSGSLLVGANLSYILTVTNRGADTATGVTVRNTLPLGVSFVSANPSQGACTQASNVITCNLDSLATNNAATITLLVQTASAGKLTNTAIVGANQFDPDSTNNSATVENTAALTADLTVNMTASPDPASQYGDLTYTITLTNNDSVNTAQGIYITNVLPATTTFNTALIGTDSSACTYTENLHTVTCYLSSLPAGKTATVTIVVTTAEAGTLTNTVNVVTDTVDPTANTATLSVEVVLNIITETVDNTGKTLTNYTISSTGGVRNGSFAGTIVNQGIIYSTGTNTVEILAGAEVRGGGKLGGTINNYGTIRNMTLLAGTVINGGVLRGTIHGFPSSPALLQGVIVGANARLENVIISPNVTLDSSVVLGEGVVFQSSTNIPAGIDLTNLYPKLTDPVTGSEVVDLSTDIVAGTDLLSAINALPDLQNYGFVFTQTATGLMILPIGTDHIVVMPVSVTQANANQTAGITLNVDGSATIVTATRRVIVVQPAVEDSSALRTALGRLGVATYEYLMDGTLYMPIDSTAYFKARPALVTNLSSGTTGLIFQASPYASNVLTTLFKYGAVRQQYLYGTPVDRSQLNNVLQDIPNVQLVQLNENGTGLVQIGSRTYIVVFDYIVRKGTPSSITQLQIVADQNGDGSDDALVVYTNGDRQIIYVIPQPDVAEDIQAIPAVKNANYLVSSDAEENLLLARSSSRLYLNPTNIVQLQSVLSPSMSVYDDGHVVFITPTARQVTAQPLIQDIDVFTTGINALGFDTVIQNENGNITLRTSNPLVSSVARPATVATVPLITISNEGVSSLSYILPNLTTLRLVFRNDNGTLWQQYIYPAAKEPDNLRAFFQAMPSVQTVTFNNDGTLTVKNAQYNFSGRFDYVVTATGVPTSGIQFSSQADANGDGLSDFIVTYGNGDRQLIYRLP